MPIAGSCQSGGFGVVTSSIPCHPPRLVCKHVIDRLSVGRRVVSSSSRRHLMGSIASRSAAMGSVKELISIKLKERKVLVISKSSCPFCHKAKDVLGKYNMSDDVYEVIEIDSRPDCHEIQEYMREITGARSVPRVFINGRCIGGGDDTVHLETSGKLEPMLKECGAI